MSGEGASSDLAAGLYLIATPIGNVEDIGLRARRILRDADGVLCEDKRKTARLLRDLGVRAKRLFSYHDRSPPSARAGALRLLKEGRALALVSDGGTPLISDPGYKLARAVIEDGLPLHAVPGPSSVLAALSLSGLPPDRFAFLGFLPPKEGDRRRALEPWREAPFTLIIFCPARRVKAALKSLLEILGDRPLAILREMTKTYEAAERGSLKSLSEAYEERADPRGEVTLVVGAGEKEKKRRERGA